MRGVADGQSVRDAMSQEFVPNLQPRRVAYPRKQPAKQAIKKPQKRKRAPPKKPAKRAKKDVDIFMKH